MFPRSDSNPYPSRTGFGRRITFPARIRLFPVLRIAALWEAFFQTTLSIPWKKNIGCATKS